MTDETKADAVASPYITIKKAMLKRALFAIASSSVIERSINALWVELIEQGAFPPPSKGAAIVEPIANADSRSQEKHVGTFPRKVSHDEALRSAYNFINQHFNNTHGKGVLTGIPARPDHDDILLTDYIMQQRVADTPKPDVAPVVTPEPMTDQDKVIFGKLIERIMTNAPTEMAFIHIVHALRILWAKLEELTPNP